MLRSQFAIAGLAVAAVTSWAAAGARACGLDGIPSISANGGLAVLMTSKPSRSQLATWAPFTFTRTFQAGQSVVFSENLSELRRSLPTQAFGRAWRWHLGDGSTVEGPTAMHRYRKPGIYRVTVQAFYRDYGVWYQFDAAIVRVR